MTKAKSCAMLSIDNKKRGEIMELKEFNETVGRIVGVKSGVEWVDIHKNIQTREVRVRLVVKANERQIQKLMAIILNHNNNK